MLYSEIIHEGIRVEFEPPLETEQSLAKAPLYSVVATYLGETLDLADTITIEASLMADLSHIGYDSRRAQRLVSVLHHYLPSHWISASL